MSELTNLFADIPANLSKELIETILVTPEVRIERIVSPPGHSSPAGFWYDQAENEWVLLIAGAARLRLEEEIVEMKPVSFVNIAAHRRHRVEWTDPDRPTVWLAIYYPAA